MNVSIVGVGRLGGALALALSKAGYRIENLIVRNPETAAKIARSINPKPKIITLAEAQNLTGSEIILIAAQDWQIASVAAHLTGKLPNNPFVFHTSGSLSSEILQCLADAGCRVGSLHPLVSVSDSFLGAQKFKDVFFCLEGAPEAVRVSEKIVLDLEGKSFSVETKFKTLYHAAAVTAAGHLTALVSVAVEMLAACGLSEEKAQEIFLPLIKSAVGNLETQNPARALTGTFARADVETMKRHLAALRENVSPELLAVYLQLGIRSTHLAERQGANAENLAQMREILQAENKRRTIDL